MQEQSAKAAENAIEASWVVDRTLVFQVGWSWAATRTVKPLGPPADGNQCRQFPDPVPHSDPPMGTGVVLSPAPATLKEDHAEPRHPDLEYPVVADFVNFGLKNVPAVTPEKGDVKVTNAYNAISPYVTLKEIYKALIKICRDRKAETIAKGIWRIEVNHRDLVAATSFSERSISDALPELAAHGYILRHPEKWGGKHASQYYVRDVVPMTTILQAAGVEYSRKMGGGHIALFRVVDEVKDDVIARI
jgi:hypothetical protein